MIIKTMLVDVESLSLKKKKKKNTFLNRTTLAFLLLMEMLGCIDSPVNDTPSASQIQHNALMEKIF